jgi:hypothetical protein
MGWDKPVAAVQEDAVYTAVYREIPIYTVRFVNDDGAEIASAKYQAGTPASQVSVPEDPQKEATESVIYPFAGWDKPITPVEGDSVYTATYREELRQYTVRFTDEEGMELSAALYPYGTPVENIAVPQAQQREATAEYAYSFAGWEPEVAAVVARLQQARVAEPLVRHQVLQAPAVVRLRELAAAGRRRIVRYPEFRRERDLPLARASGDVEQFLTVDEPLKLRNRRLEQLRRKRPDKTAFHSRRLLDRQKGLRVLRHGALSAHFAGRDEVVA